ncbi:tRNA pseudouridine(55) synthase TruB, partial [Salmonella enterica]|uniref:tRNA pseudouridine(55) synthase TruB n=1 Tax=Salmonella enterica TaxID=28901 RepID=UPI003298FBC5
LEHLQTLVAQAGQQGVPAAQWLGQLLLPMDSPASGYPVVNLPLTSSVYFKNGKPVRTTGAPLKGLVRVTQGEDHKFIGMG